MDKNTILVSIILIVVIAVAAIFAIRQIVIRARRGSACCGEHEMSEKRISVSDRNKNHYAFALELSIGGMTCENCARKVENALNSLDGVWARVSIGSHTAAIRCKAEPDEAALREAVRGAGYVVMDCKKA